MLLEALELHTLDLSTQLTYTASIDGFFDASRLDAEYYQPKFYRLLEKIAQTKQAVRLRDWVEKPIQRGAQPSYNEEGKVPVINSQHVGTTAINLDDTRKTDWAFVKSSNNKRGLVKRSDVLSNSTGVGTIGRCQVMLEDTVAVVDSHISVIRPEADLNPVYLSLFLSSTPGYL